MYMRMRIIAIILLLCRESASTPINQYHAILNILINRIVVDLLL